MCYEDIDNLWTLDGVNWIIQKYVVALLEIIELYWVELMVGKSEYNRWVDFYFVDFSWEKWSFNPTLFNIELVLDIHELEILLTHILCGKWVLQNILAGWQLRSVGRYCFFFSLASQTLHIKPSSDRLSSISGSIVNFMVRNIGNFKNSESILSDFDPLHLFISLVVKKDQIARIMILQIIGKCIQPIFNDIIMA